jgi:hypothetical protein
MEYIAKLWKEHKEDKKVVDKYFSELSDTNSAKFQERFEDIENIYSTLYGCKGSIVTGLWSFDRFLFNDIFGVLQRSFQYMERAIQLTAGIDIEHSFYHFIDRDKIINVPVLGLDLIKGMDGDRFSL